MSDTRTAVFCLCVGLFLVDRSAPTGAQSDIIVNPDSYAVFAAALKGGDSGPAGPIALLQETRAVTDCPDDRAVPPEWKAVVANHKKENARVRTLRPDADLGRSYSLVSLAALRSLMRSAGYTQSHFSGVPLPGANIEQSPGAVVFGRFPGGRLHAVSAVGFNEQKTRAMVTAQVDCFPANIPSAIQHCHGGKQVMLEKENGHWISARGIGCGWIA